MRSKEVVFDGCFKKGLLCKLGIHKWREVYRTEFPCYEKYQLLSEQIKYRIKYGRNPEKRPAIVKECVRMRNRDGAIVGCWKKVKVEI